MSGVGPLTMLRGTYFPKHEDNRMKSEGDLSRARKVFFETKPTNLHFLLSKRYSWMNAYLEPQQKVIELGSGAGFSQEFITKAPLILTDFNKTEWVAEKVDALNTPYADSSIDVVICSHMIHHLATPHKFFSEMNRILKPGGKILISEINTSLIMRILLRLMRHEGWSYEVDVFDKAVIANDPSDPWSANCAIPELLFSKPTVFEKVFPSFKVTRNRLVEFAIFPLSGGVIAKTKTIPLPRFALQLIHLVDRFLIALMPQVFALGREVVLEKSK